MSSTSASHRHAAVLAATLLFAVLAGPAAAQHGTDAGTAPVTAIRADAAAALADLATAVLGPVDGTALADLPADTPAGRLHAIGVVHGRADGAFLPGSVLSRAQLASLASRLLEVLRQQAAAAVPARFSDVADHPHAAGIAAAARDGLVLGRPDGTFVPNAPATATHLATVELRLRGVLVAEGLLASDDLPDPVIAHFDTPEGSFRVLIDRPAAINRLAGAEPGTHVGIPNGRILPGDGGVNAGHDWHLVDVEIVDIAMEICDGTAAYIDRVGLDAWYRDAGDRYCPWGAIYLGSEPA